MPEWLTPALITYGIVCLVWITLWMITYYDDDPMSSSVQNRRKQRYAARMVVFFPLWPVLMLIILLELISKVVSTVPEIISVARGPKEPTCPYCGSEDVVISVHIDTQSTHCFDCRRSSEDQRGTTRPDLRHEVDEGLQSKR